MKIKKTISSLFLSIYYTLLSSKVAFAQNSSDYIYEKDVVSLGWIVALAENILSVALQFVGVVAFIMLLIGGVKVLTSGGNPEAMETGKKTLTMAIAGLFIAVFSWFILNILGVITGVNLIEFAIPTLSSNP